MTPFTALANTPRPKVARVDDGGLRTRSRERRELLYESRKKRWIAEHPDATCQEYQAAMRQLAQDCRI